MILVNAGEISSVMSAEQIGEFEHLSAQIDSSFAKSLVAWGSVVDLHEDIRKLIYVQ